MDQSWSMSERKRAVDEALKRAATDQEFRALIKRDPSAAVQQVAGKSLPSNYRIRVLDRDGFDATIILPDPVSATGELSDSELEQVAGGRGACGVSCGIGTNF